MKVRGTRLGLAFFQQDASALAEGLIGTTLVRRWGGREYRARIAETEAYLGPADLASHSSKGRTRRTEVMFGPAGRAYVYLIYGMHDMFNIVAGPAGSANAVLIRAAEPLEAWDADLSGPGKLARAMRITRAENGLDLTTSDALFLLRSGQRKVRIGITPRIGVDYAGPWKDAMLRYVDLDSPAISKRKWSLGFNSRPGE